MIFFERPLKKVGVSIRVSSLGSFYPGGSASFVKECPLRMGLTAFDARYVEIILKSILYAMQPGLREHAGINENSDSKRTILWLLLLLLFNLQMREEDKFLIDSH